MENPHDIFIPPFTPMQQPKPKKPVGLIIAVVLLLLVSAGLGAGLYLQMTQAQDLQRQVDELKLSAADAEEAAKAQQEVKKVNDYRQIAELGVMYKVTDDLKELTYAYDGTEGIAMAKFATTELVTLKDKKGNYPCAPGVSGMIVRYDEKPTVKEVTEIKEIGGKFFVYTPAQNECKVDGKPAEGLKEAGDKVKAVFDSLEAM